jgi:hypothetical protein
MVTYQSIVEGMNSCDYNINSVSKLSNGNNLPDWISFDNSLFRWFINTDDEDNIGTWTVYTTLEFDDYLSSTTDITWSVEILEEIVAFVVIAQTAPYYMAEPTDQVMDAMEVLEYSVGVPFDNEGHEVGIEWDSDAPFTSFDEDSGTFTFDPNEY